MARLRPWFVRSAPLLVLIGGGLHGALPEPASAGPLVRRAQERKACQEFATKLQEAGGNTPAAQQVYQQGVLQLVARGCSNRAIAEQLQIAPSTARDHVHDILRRLRVRTRAAAAVEGWRRGYCH